jgi:hypothetical protein
VSDWLDEPDDTSRLEERYRAAFAEHSDESLELANSFGSPVSKRLTEPELAAEMWARRVEELELSRDGYDPWPAREEAEVWGRFAILPHYDEADDE